MLRDVVAALRCPHCGSALARGSQSLRCAQGHSFDIARQGYVSLLPATSGGDTAEMVAARATFLASGHYAPITDQVAAAAADVGPGLIVDLGAGTGHYLAAALDAAPASSGIALDVSKYAGRRAAKAHPRLGSVVADVWRQVPIASAAAATVLNVFAPRNAPETHRILRPGGALVVVTPESAHLGELVAELGLLQVDLDKQARLSEQLDDWFIEKSRTRCDFPMLLHHNDIQAVVSMGPSAWHTAASELATGIARLPEPFMVHAAVSVSVYERRNRDLVDVADGSRPGETADRGP